VTVRRLLIAVGAVLLLAGVIGLLAPASVSDGNGHSVGCGNAFATDLSAARNADKNNVVADVPVLNEVVPHTDYVALCRSSLGSRRAWTIPLAVAGGDRDRLASAGSTTRRTENKRLSHETPIGYFGFSVHICCCAWTLPI
jgi:hypothetical protein